MMFKAMTLQNNKIYLLNNNSLNKNINDYPHIKYYKMQYKFIKL